MTDSTKSTGRLYIAKDLWNKRHKLEGSFYNIELVLDETLKDGEIRLGE